MSTNGQKTEFTPSAAEPDPSTRRWIVQFVFHDRLLSSEPLDRKAAEILMDNVEDATGGGAWLEDANTQSSATPKQ